MKATHLLRDRDSKFTAMFDTILKAQGIKVQQLPIRSPNLNAYAERFAVLSATTFCTFLREFSPLEVYAGWAGSAD